MVDGDPFFLPGRPHWQILSIGRSVEGAHDVDAPTSAWRSTSTETPNRQGVLDFLPAGLAEDEEIKE